MKTKKTEILFACISGLTGANLVCRFPKYGTSLQKIQEKDLIAK